MTIEQKKMIQSLKMVILEKGEWEDILWDTFILFQGYPFFTSGRREGQGLPFSFYVKIGKNGDYVREIIFSRREKSKTITKSTVHKALMNALEVQKNESCVKGPKRLGTFGASYLYPIFIEFGLISRKPDC